MSEPTVQMNKQLFDHNKELLEMVYEESSAQITTLAKMVTGVILGAHAQLWMIAIWLHFDVLLLSQVKTFNRFLSNKDVDVRKYFHPFVLAMHASLGYEIAYIVLDCTKAGSKCRALVAGLVYHQTVLPIAWKTYKGSKGHLRGIKQRELLEELPPCFANYTHVVVLGDGEFSNKSVISLLLEREWDFVLRFQNSYLIQTEDSEEWLSAAQLYQRGGLKAGMVLHWENVTYTQTHLIEELTFTAQWDEGHCDPLCLISTLPITEMPHLVYEMRYFIETLFGNHKSRGFQLERTHLTDPDKIDRLFLVLAIATCMVLGLGTHVIVIQETHSVDRSERRDLSLFQLGHRYFIRLLALNRLSEFKMYFRWDFKLPPPGFQPAT